MYEYMHADTKSNDRISKIYVKGLHEIPRIYWYVCSIVAHTAHAAAIEGMPYWMMYVL